MTELIAGFLLNLAATTIGGLPVMAMEKRKPRKRRPPKGKHAKRG